MIKLSPISGNLKKEYFEKISEDFEIFLESLKDKENTQDLNEIKIAEYKREVLKIYKYLEDSNGENWKLDKEKIKKLVIGDLKELLRAMDYIGPITSKRLKDKFGEFYKKISSRDFLQEWALKIGVTVCPYCNRNFIFTVPRHTGNGGVRPEYDHFFPKSKYPYLAASMYNLIPSCSVCNKAKSNRNSYKNHEVQYLYPYEEGYGEQVVLKIEDKNKPTDKVTAWLGSAEEYTVYPECSKEVDSEKKKRVENSWEMFKLGPLYEKHSDYIRNILQAKQIYTEEYLNQLIKSFPGAFDDMDDLRNVVYFNYLDEEGWGKRILAKLTHDLEAEDS